MAVAFQPNAFQNDAFQVGDTGGLTTSAITETSKADDGGRVDIQGLGNPVKISDTLTVQRISPNQLDVVAPTQAIRVSDTLTVSLTGPQTVLVTESLKTDEGGRVDIRGLGNPVKISDSISVSLFGGGVGTLTVSLSESHRIADSGEVELSRDEIVRIAESLTVTRTAANTISVAASTQAIRVSDTLTVVISPLRVSAGPESVKIADAPTVVRSGQPPVITPDTWPHATIGVPYSRTVVSVGGTPPITYSIVAGSLPPGMTLNAATGEVSGTPLSSGTFSVTIQASDNS